MKKYKWSFTIVLYCFLLLSCDNDTYEVMYLVDAKDDMQLAKIVYLNNNSEEKIIPETYLPWSYKFDAEEGDSIRLSARIFTNGNYVYTGKDTLKIFVYVDSEIHKENSVYIKNSSSDYVSIIDKL